MEMVEVGLWKILLFYKKYVHTGLIESKYMERNVTTAGLTAGDR